MQPAEERPSPRPRPTSEPAATPRADAGTTATATGDSGRSRPALRIASGVTPGVLTAGVGALLTFLAAFLTWATVEVTSRTGGPLVGGGTRSVSGLEGDRLGKGTLVLALAALALCVLLLQPSSRAWGWLALAVIGGLIVVLAVLDLVAISDASDLRDRLAQVPGCSQLVQCTGDRSAGFGVYLTIVGGLVVLAGALLHHGAVDTVRNRRRRRRAASAAPASNPEAAEPASTEPTGIRAETDEATSREAGDEPAGSSSPAT